MKNKAIILDVDGTIINSPKQKLPSKKLIESIDKVKDKYFVCVATGRTWTFAKPIINSLKLTKPCILADGTQICDPVSGKTLLQKTIDNEALSKLL